MQPVATAEGVTTVTPDCNSQIEEGLTFSLNVGLLKRLSRKRENVVASESIILRAFLPRGKLPLSVPVHYKLMYGQTNKLIIKIFMLVTCIGLMFMS